MFKFIASKSFLQFIFTRHLRASRHQHVGKVITRNLLCERALILCYLNPVSNNSIPAKKAENLRFVWKLKAKKSSFVESINTVYLENLTIVIQPDFKCYEVSLEKITVGWNFIIEYAFPIYFL